MTLDVREWQRLKKLLEVVLSWLAFINAGMVVNIPIYLVLCSKCDMFENKSLYYHVTNGYFDFLATLPGQGLWLLFGLSPAIWLLLFIWTGSVRIIPWVPPGR